MFQFPGFPSYHYFIRKYDTMTLLIVCCHIRKSADYSLRATPRSLSQLITSFIASVSLGIRHTPFLTFFTTVFLLLVSE